MLTIWNSREIKIIRRKIKQLKLCTQWFIKNLWKRKPLIFHPTPQTLSHMHLVRKILSRTPSTLMTICQETKVPLLIVTKVWSHQSQDTPCKTNKPVLKKNDYSSTIQIFIVFKVTLIYSLCFVLTYSSQIACYLIKVSLYICKRYLKSTWNIITKPHCPARVSSQLLLNLL